MSMPRPPQLPPEQLRAILEDLLTNFPSFEYGVKLSDKDARWIAKCEAVLESIDQIGLTTDFRVAVRMLGTYSHNPDAVRHPVLKAYYQIELQSPVELQGTFIPAGDAWGGYQALVKVMGSDCDSILVVDAYMDGQTYCDFIPLAKAREEVRCLTEKNYAQSLNAAHSRFCVDNAGALPKVEVRYAPKKSLHDRLIIIDRDKVWLVSQSLNHIAARSPASVVLAEPEIARMKIEHYEALWLQGEATSSD